MKHVLTVLMAWIAGFVGALTALYVPALKPVAVPPTMRAQRFELVDSQGRALAFWGVNKQHEPVLAFGARGGEGSVFHGPFPSDLSDPQNQFASFGMQANDSPMLKMSGPDRNERATLMLSQDAQPFLAMGDGIKDASGWACK